MMEQISMYVSILTGSVAGLGCSLVFSWAFNKYNGGRLYSLECDIADLQDRHLRSVRKASADKRWQGEEEFDEKISSALSATPQKQKRWMKWDSSRNSNLEKSSVDSLKDSLKADPS